ncbi:hypothetical protein Scep_004010 [Stephania cephalantha]|uniref:Uncharacterized protein n=1 Tax=Stephania cephalantha TaxID=152367 RepID=A0AAP0PYM0_9MAGN
MFCVDRWATTQFPLRNYSTSDIRLVMINQRVCEYVKGDWQWDWMKMQDNLPTDILATIATMKPPQPDDGPDELMWSNSKHGDFSIASAKVPETHLHVLRDCKVANIIWIRLIPSRHWRDFFEADLKT